MKKQLQSLGTSCTRKLCIPLFVAIVNRSYGGQRHNDAVERRAHIYLFYRSVKCLNDLNVLFNEEVRKEQKQMTSSGNCQRAKQTIYYCSIICLHIMHQFMFGFSVRGNTQKRPKPHQNHPKPHSKHTKYMNLGTA